MGIAVKESDAGSTVTIQGAVDIGSAAELKAALLQALNAGREIQVVLADVSYMDVSAVQLLWAAEKHARRCELEFQILGSLPEPVSTVLSDAGFPSLSASVTAG